MKVTARIDYACRALLELGLHWPNNQPLQVAEIARRQKIPMNFLVHILITLKQMGYVESIRGKSGGYVLVQAPEKVMIGEVFKNFGGLGLSAVKKTKTSKSAHVLDAVWQELDEAVITAMETVTLESICNRERSRDKAIMYEI